MRLRPTLVGCALVVLLAGCTGAPPPAAAPATRAASATPTPSPTPTGTPLTLVAMGDSISRGFDACAHFGDCPSVSWSTGDDRRVDSIAARLQASTGRPVHAASVARSGAASDDLQRQAQDAAALQPAVVTLLIGANDVCRSSLDAMTPTDVFGARVAAALDTIHERDPGAVVLLASVPDVTALLPAAAEDPTARFLWQRAGGCATVLQDPQADDAAAQSRRAAVQERLVDYDTALQSACTAARDCVFDGGALAAYRPSIDQLSALDYFHPSVAGQRALAALEWAAFSAALEGDRLAR